MIAGRECMIPGRWQASLPETMEQCKDRETGHADAAGPDQPELDVKRRGIGTVFLEYRAKKFRKTPPGQGRRIVRCRLPAPRRDKQCHAR